MSEDDIILKANGMTKQFAGFFAVKDVDLSVRRGSIHALIGPNGAGKTTCFNLLTKFLQPTAGTITFDGRDITTMQSSDIARMGMVRSFQISAVFPKLTVLENVRVALQRRRGDSFDFWRSQTVLNQFDEEARHRVDEVGLSGFADQTADELSYGRKRALEIATTLALEPQMLLLDEPMAGMAQQDVERISALIKRISANRTTLMVEHNLSVVADLSDTITVLARGQVLAEGPYETVSKDPRVIEAYIGVGWYGESHVLHGIEFDVAPGEVVTLLGRNGAGKTTTLKAIMGILGKRKGSIRFEGKELIGAPSRTIAKAGIALCPEERAIFSSLSVDENLMLPPVVKPGGMALDTIFEMFPNLKERLNSQGTKLS
ncbi:braF, partial [Symbiodinium necroappetens]